MPSTPIRVVRAALARAVVLAAIAPATPAAAMPMFDHVVIVIEENKGFTQVIGNLADAPYINSLAAAGASLTNMYGIAHPSQPNYLHLFSGGNQGSIDNAVPVDAPFDTPNLGAALQDVGASFVGYSQGLPGEGSTVASNGPYQRKHNPWVDWQSDTPLPNQLLPATNQPFTSFPAATDYASLPTVSIVVPDQDNDMHDGTIAQGDAWLQANLGAYASWAQANNSLLVVTFDEDNSAEKNRIPTLFYGAHVVAGASVDATWTLHNLLRTVEDAYGSSHSGAAAQVRPIVGPFTTDPAHATLRFQQGVSGYTGAVDTFIEAANGAATHAADTTLVTDGDASASPGDQPTQTLIRFQDVLGGAAGQVPLGATILSAKLSVLTSLTSILDPALNDVTLHRMRVGWDGTSSWDSLADGVDLGSDADATAEFTLLPNFFLAAAIFDVTDALQAFADGTQPNLGWVIDAQGSDDWRIYASEHGVLADRPYLEVTYLVPEPSTALLTGAGALLLAARARRRLHR